MYKNLAIALVFFLPLTNAYALHWTLLSKDKEQTVEVADFDTERTTDPSVQLEVLKTWVKITESKSKTYSLSLWYIDCVNKQTSIKHVTKYNSKGKSLSSRDDMYDKYMPVIPDSMGWETARYICYYTSAKEGLVNAVKENGGDVGIVTPTFVQDFLNKERDEKIKKIVDQVVKEYQQKHPELKSKGDL